ncbi:hypothetical protein [Caballeronia sp. RCC_10]|uniref:hypothetical protein n=1 Tax=Caballeronia sp. RCC_10 TaxID=3239227 RepID=UPI003523F96D
MPGINYLKPDASGATWLPAQGLKIVSPAPPPDNTMLYVALGAVGAAFTLLIACFLRILHASTVF